MGQEQNLRVKALSGVKINASVTLYKTTLDLVSRLVLIRILAPQIFGLMSYAYIITGFVGMFTTVSSQSAVIQKRGTKIEEFIDVAFTIEFLLSAIGAIALFFFAPLIVRRLGKPELTFFTQMMSLTIPLSRLSFLNIIFTRNLDFKRANIAPAVATPINIVITILLAILGYGIWSFFWGGLASNAFSAFIVWKIVPYRPKLRLNRKILSDLIRFGLPMTGSGILAYFYWHIDDFMVGTMLGAQQLGYYWLAFKIPHYFLKAQGVISGVAFSAFSRAKDDEQLKRGFEQATKYSATFLLLPCAVVLVLGQPTIKFVFGENWLPATVPFQVFMVLVVFRGIYGYWAQVLTVKGKTKNLFLIMIQSAVILPTLGYFLTRRFGIVGMSIAVIATMFSTAPYMAIHLKNCLKIKYTDLLWRNYLSFGITIFIGLLLFKQSEVNVIKYVIACCALSIIYIISTLILDKTLVNELKNLKLRSQKILLDAPPPGG